MGVRDLGPSTTEAGNDGRGLAREAAPESLVWYNVRAFEQAGVVPPSDVVRLLEVSTVLSASGVPALPVPERDP